MTKSKVFKTNDNTILIVNVKYSEISSNPYWSITADEITPVDKDTAIQSGEDCIRDNIDNMWKEAVASDSTTDSLEDYTQQVIDESEELGNFDNSLYPEEVNIDGTTYVFESGSCGCLHDEILKVWPRSIPFIKAHLRSTSKRAQNAFDKLISDDIDAKVLEYTKEII